MVEWPAWKTSLFSGFLAKFFCEVLIFLFALSWCISQSALLFVTFNFLLFLASPLKMAAATFNGLCVYAVRSLLCTKAMREPHWIKKGVHTVLAKIRDARRRPIHKRIRVCDGKPCHSRAPLNFISICYGHVKCSAASAASAHRASNEKTEIHHADSRAPFLPLAGSPVCTAKTKVCVRRYSMANGCLGAPCVASESLLKHPICKRSMFAHRAKGEERRKSEIERKMKTRNARVHTKFYDCFFRPRLVCASVLLRFSFLPSPSWLRRCRHRIGQWLIASFNGTNICRNNLSFEFNHFDSIRLRAKFICFSNFSSCLSDVFGGSLSLR